MQMQFDGQQYPYASRRRVVYGRRGMVCTSQPLASQAGLQILQQGGNAIDAAIATAICQTVVEPTNNGFGSDCFAIVWVKNKLYGINGSGYAPQNLTAEAVRAAGHTDKMPFRGWQAVTVPGAPSAWAELHKRFGRLPFAQLFAPAIDYAENGYPVSPNMSRLWEEADGFYTKYKDRPEFKGWFDTFEPNGHWLQPGEVFKNPDMAKSLRLIAETYGDAFYKGELADKIDAFMQEHNGFLRKSDLEAYKPEWVEPLSVNYRGYDIWELPPNGHGITVLMALNILKGYNFTERDTVETMHKQIEAMKLSFVDTKEYVAEPSYMKVTAEQLLSERYAADRRALINDKALEPVVGDPRYSSTVYFCTADAEGNMVSMIQSNYRGFGSGIVVPGTSISFNDRAENFSFDETHPNALQGGKRPYHTIIPAFMTKDGQAVSAFGIMGGFMQPQAHVQVAMNMIDFGLNPQQALDAPRWQWIGGKTVEVEQDTPNHIIRQLQRMGHNVVVQPDPYHMGRGQIIIRDEDGVLCGATEKRTDGQIACF